MAERPNAERRKVVLIVTKTTNYELHGAVIEAKVAQGRMAPDALSRLQTAHAEHYDTLARLRVALGRRGVAYDEVSRDFPRPWSKSYDLVLTVGGDGTLLSASHQVAGGGVLAGIRSSLTSVGFLCCAGPSDVDALAQAIADGQWASAPVARLQAELKRIDTGATVATGPVLNDFLYTNANPAATTRYRLAMGEKTEVQRSSGIWVATAIGSTAAILAAGGQRAELADPRFQYRVRELYRLGLSAPTLEGGFFDPDREELIIENRCQSAILALDGQHGVLDLVYGDSVRFFRAADVQLVRSFPGATARA